MDLPQFITKMKIFIEIRSEHAKAPGLEIGFPLENPKYTILRSSKAERQDIDIRNK